MRDKLIPLVLRLVEEQSRGLPTPLPLEKGLETPLYGAGGGLDSIGLVRLIVEIEAAIEEEFQVSIILANDRAMSRKASPFLSVGTLVAYLEELLVAAGVKQSS